MEIKLDIKNMSKQKKASISYIIASFFTQGINFVTLPIYTRLLSTSDMGIITTFTSWYSIIYAIGTLSLSSGSMSVALIEFKHKRDKYQSVCLTLSTISALLFSLMFILFTIKSNSFNISKLGIGLILCLLLIFNPALDSWYLRERYEYKYKKVLLVSIITSLFTTFIPITCVCIAKYYSFENLGDLRIISQYGVIIIISIFFYMHIMKKGKCFFNKKMMKFALNLSIPLIVHTLAKNILDTSDRLMIANMCGNSEAGIYGTVYNISMVAIILWNAINSAVVPIIFEYLDEKKYKQVENLTIKILILFSVGSILITLIAPEILYILTTSEYFNAVHMIPAIASGIYFTAVYGVYGNMLLFKKKSFQIMIATSCSAIINIILNYIFINRYGYMAASYTTLVSFAILALLQGMMQKFVYKVEVVSTIRIAVISLITISLCLMCNIIYNHFIIRYFIIMIIVLIGFKRKEYLRKIFIH